MGDLSSHFLYTLWKEGGRDGGKGGREGREGGEGGEGGKGGGVREGSRYIIHVCS